MVIQYNVLLEYIIQPDMLIQVISKSANVVYLEVYFPKYQCINPYHKTNSHVSYIELSIW